MALRTGFTLCATMDDPRRERLPYTVGERCATTLLQRGALQARVLFGVALLPRGTLCFTEAPSPGHYSSTMPFRFSCCVVVLLLGCSDGIGSPESFAPNEGAPDESAEADSMVATTAGAPAAAQGASPSNESAEGTSLPDATDQAATADDGTTADDPDADANTTGGTDDDMPTSTGAELFATLCAPCHGEAGAGSELGPEVQHPVREFAAWVVRNGYSGAFDAPMPNYAPEVLSDDDLSSIIDYLRELPAPTTEEGLYLDYCANCHGSDARGGPSGKEIAGKSELAEVVRQGKGGSNFGARHLYMPSWGASELDASTVTALERFVGDLPE